MSYGRRRRIASVPAIPTLHSRERGRPPECNGPAYGRAVTITYDEVLREQIRANLTGYDRRAVTDPTKRHAAVAVVLVDSEIGEDRVDPAPVDDWMAGRPMPEAGLDGRMIDVSGGAAFLLCRRASRLTSHAAQWALSCCNCGGYVWKVDMTRSTGLSNRYSPGNRPQHQSYKSARSKRSCHNSAPRGFHSPSWPKPPTARHHNGRRASLARIDPS